MKEITGDQTETIKVDGSSDEVTASFEALNVKLATVVDENSYKVTPTAASTYDIKTRVNGTDYAADGDFVEIGDEIEVIVEVVDVITATNTQTIAVTKNGEDIGAVSFNSTNVVGDYDSVSFKVADTDDIQLAVESSNAPTTEAKILSATMYDSKGTPVKTVADAKTIVVVFDTAMDKTSAETETNWSGDASGAVTDASLSDNGLTLTLTVGTAFADGEAFDDYSSVEAANGAGISTTSVTFNDGSSTATIVE